MLLRWWLIPYAVQCCPGCGNDGYEKWLFRNVKLGHTWYLDWKSSILEICIWQTFFPQNFAKPHWKLRKKRNVENRLYVTKFYRPDTNGESRKKIRKKVGYSSGEKNSLFSRIQILMGFSEKKSEKKLDTHRVKKTHFFRETRYQWGFAKKNGQKNGYSSGESMSPPSTKIALSGFFNLNCGECHRLS